MGPSARSDGLLIREVGDQLVVYDEERGELHVLNKTAAIVFRYCDGQRTPAELAAELTRELDVPTDESIALLAMQELDEAHLLEEQPAAGPGLTRVSRRVVLRRAAAVGAGVLLPTILSLGAFVTPALAGHQRRGGSPQQATSTTGGPPPTSSPPTTTPQGTSPSPTTTTTAAPTTTTPAPPTTTAAPPTTTAQPPRDDDDDDDDGDNGDDGDDDDGDNDDGDDDDDDDGDDD